MRRPFNKISKKCAIAIMAAAMVMSTEAQTVICPMVVYADDQTPGSSNYYNANTGDILVSGGTCQIVDNMGRVTVNGGGTVQVTNNGPVVSGGTFSGGTISGCTVTINSGGTATVSNNAEVGTITINSGGAASAIVNESGGNIVVNAGGYLTAGSNISNARIDVNSGGNASAGTNSDGATVNVNAGGTMTLNSNLSDAAVNVNSGGSATLAENGEGGVAMVLNGGTMTLNDNGREGMVTVEGGGNITLATNNGQAYLESGTSGGSAVVIVNAASGYVENGGGTIMSNYGSAVILSGGTLMSNYGNVQLSGGTIMANYSGGSVAGNGSVRANYGGTVQSGINASDDYCLVSITEIDSNAEASYGSSFENMSGGRYIQTVRNSSAVNSANGIITISPKNGYKITGSASANVTEATFRYTLEKSGDNYLLTVYPNGNVSISFDQLQLAVSAIEQTIPEKPVTPPDDNNKSSANINTGASKVEEPGTNPVSAGPTLLSSTNPDNTAPTVVVIHNPDDQGQVITEASVLLKNNKVASKVVPYSSKEIRKMIDDAFATARKAANGTNPKEIVLNFSTDRSFSAKSANTLFKYLKPVAKRCFFSINGVKYELYIPANVDMGSKAYKAAMDKLKKTEETKRVDLIKFAEIFNRCGVKLIQVK